MRLLSVIGTRPEAIKMAPVLKKLSGMQGFCSSSVCTTGQHREIFSQALEIFGVSTNHDLALMKAGQDLTYVTTEVLSRVGSILDELKPDWVLVHGDTTTTMAASLAAFYRKIPVAHIEAGLRTGCKYSPWPEEVNRLIADRIADLHFAPTDTAKQNLLREGISSDSILVTGNTVVDALFWVLRNTLQNSDVGDQMQKRFGFLRPDKRTLLVTGHRRENFDGGLDCVCRALVRLAERDDVQIIYPVHPNPNVLDATRRILQDKGSIHLIEPLDYLSFVWLMSFADIIITDSGGVQEEAPSLGKPVLVTRDTTERPEAVEAGTVKLVGTHTELIVSATEKLLDDNAAYAEMARSINPYGDGHAAERIVDRLLEEL